MAGSSPRGDVSPWQVPSQCERWRCLDYQRRTDDCFHFVRTQQADPAATLAAVVWIPRSSLSRRASREEPSGGPTPSCDLHRGMQAGSGSGGVFRAI